MALERFAEAIYSRLPEKAKNYISSLIPQEAIENSPKARERESKLRETARNGWGKASYLERELTDERKHREEILRQKEREIRKEYFEQIAQMADTLGEVRKKMETTTSEAQKQLEYHRGQLTSLRKNGVIIPVLRTYEKLHPQFRETPIVYLDNRLNPSYATPAFFKLLGKEDQNISENPEIEEAMMQIKQDGKTTLINDQTLRKKIYKITDGEERIIGTIIQLTPEGKQRFRRLRDSYNSVREAIKGIGNIIYTKPSEQTN